jgi:hypothetical protein
MSPRVARAGAPIPPRGRLPVHTFTTSVDTKSFDPGVDGMSPADLHALERPITFIVLASAATAPTADASDHIVNYTGTDSTYEVGALSESGKKFGVLVDRSSGAVHYVDGEVDRW